MKKLINKKLVGFLMEHKKIEMVTVDRTHIVCQCKKNFLPADLEELVRNTGQEKPKLSTSQGINYVILNRY